MRTQTFKIAEFEELKKCWILKNSAILNSAILNSIIWIQPFWIQLFWIQPFMAW